MEIGSAIQANLLGGNIYKFIYNELDTSGDFVSELISLDWQNGNDSIVPNIGANAPANTDMNWVTDAAYALIPADPSNPTDDILGNPPFPWFPGFSALPSPPPWPWPDPDGRD